jgi:hypothetical protein
MGTAARAFAVAPLVVCGLVAGGCFYNQSINQRPSADIVAASSAPVFRGDTVEFSADGDDPQDGEITYRWRAYACIDATTPSGCDMEPFSTSILDTASFTVPDNLVGGQATQALRIVLEGSDDAGAITDPDPVLVLAVEDHAPTIAMRVATTHGFVTGIPVDLYARYTDADDGAAALDIAWTAFAPASGGTFTLAPLAAPVDTDPAYLQQGQLLVPTGDGAWTVSVTATDALGETATAMQTIMVDGDQPACIGQVEPIVATAPAALPISAPTLFEVLVVTDDLDVYPPVPSDPILGTAQFQWSLLPPGATTRVPLADSGNSVELDPTLYSPGDVLELRVEIADRAHDFSTVDCVDSEATCSRSAVPGCDQRLTWRVEVQ